MKTDMRRLALMAALGMILSLAGCSSSAPRVAVKGKVHNNDEPLRVQELASGAGGRVMVRFHSQGDTPPGYYSALVKSDGTFSVPGPSGNGIPPGKYRVEITWQDTYPMGKDKLEGKFGKQNSPVILDIPGHDDIDINVANATGR